MTRIDAIERLQDRRDGIRQWLSDEAPYTAHDQNHLNAASPEQAYWHHGYMSALEDVMALLASGASAKRSRGSEDIEDASHRGAPDEPDCTAVQNRETDGTLSRTPPLRSRNS
jgi:hypothetical protein